MRRLLSLALLLPLALAACNSSHDADPALAPTAEDIAASTTPQPDVAANRPPIKQPSATDVPMPGGGAPVMDTVGPEDFGALRFGVSRTDADKSVGTAFEAAGATGKGCYIAHRAGQPDIGYLFDGGKLMRIDVRTPGVLADGGGRVGMRIDEIRTLYAGHLTEQPGKYDPNTRLLKVGGDKPGSGGLIFETDANGTVTSYRAGLPPALDYVEGCS